MFTRMLSILFPKETIMLGRWNTRECSNIKNIMANYDHCGDIICKNPKEITNLVEKELIRRNVNVSSINNK